MHHDTIRVVWILLVASVGLSMLACSSSSGNPTRQTETSDAGTSDSSTSDAATAEAATAPKTFAEATHWTGDNSINFGLGGYNVWIDPVGVPNASASAKAELLFLTHSHSDHLSSATISSLADPAKTVVIVPDGMQPTVAAFYQGTITPMKVGDRLEFGNLAVKAVPAYNLVKTSFHPKANGWLGYVFESGGLSIYVTGDTERVPEMLDITADLIFLPLGQTYTMNSVDEAVAVVQDVGASVAVPVHFGSAEGKAADATSFAAALEPGVTVVQLPNE